VKDRRDKTMDLLERYLQAVAEYLPVKNRTDVLAELRTNLEAQIEAHEEELHRPLTEDEAAEILRGHGHPSVVAARYQPQRSLIGPEVFPYYWFTLRRTFPWVVAISLLSQLVPRIFGSPQHFQVGPVIVGLFTALFYFFGWMTIVFGAIDFIRIHYPQKISCYANWDPRKLPKVEPQDKLDLPKNPLLDLILTAVFTALWLGFLWHELTRNGSWSFHGLPLEYASWWLTFFWVLAAMSCMQVVFKMIALFPAARPWRKPMNLIEKLFGFGMLMFLLRTQEYIVLAPTVSDPKSHELVATLNPAIHHGLEIAAVIVALTLLWDLWHLIAESRHPGEITHMVA
jgi:hypothetical protein